jgi:hypothetical protein
MGQQGDHDHHGLSWRAQPIEDSAFGVTEGLVTFFTDEALVLLGMNANVALADVASGVAIEIGAEYACGIHGSSPDDWREIRLQEYAGLPIFFASGPHHG